jgi:hypothetical protein
LAERSKSTATGLARRLRAVPCPTIGIFRIGHLRQRAMHSSPLRRNSCPVYRGSHQWMPEADAHSDLDELRVFCRTECASLDAEVVSRAPDKRRVTRRLDGGQQQQSPC